MPFQDALADALADLQTLRDQRCLAFLRAVPTRRWGDVVRIEAQPPTFEPPTTFTVHEWWELQDRAKWWDLPERWARYKLRRRVERLVANLND